MGYFVDAQWFDVDINGGLDELSVPQAQAYVSYQLLGS